MVTLAFGFQKPSPANRKKFDVNSSLIEDLTHTNIECQWTNYYF